MTEHDRTVRDSFSIVKADTDVGDPESGAKQSFFDQTDINCIMRKFAATGFLQPLNEGVYADVTMFKDMTAAEAFARVDEMRAGFANLPAEVRAAANNDIHRYLAMLETPEGVEVLNAAGKRDVPVRPGPLPAEPQAKGAGEAGGA